MELQPLDDATGAHPHPVIASAQRRGNHGAAAMMVRWRVLNLNEIANPRIE